MRKKLKLEELEVTSFDTASVAPMRGTVDGHARPTRFEYTCACQNTDPLRDCTLGCSMGSACPDNCIINDYGTNPIAII